MNYFWHRLSHSISSNAWHFLCTNYTDPRRWLFVRSRWSMHILGWFISLCFETLVVICWAPSVYLQNLVLHRHPLTAICTLSVKSTNNLCRNVSKASSKSMWQVLYLPNCNLWWEVGLIHNYLRQTKLVIRLQTSDGTCDEKTDVC